MKAVASIFLLFVVVVCASKDAIKLSDNAESLWADYLATYPKSYSSEEAPRRYAAFQNNLKTIDHLNEQDDQATFGITKFADLTAQEFSNQYLMPFYRSKAGFNYEPVAPKAGALPDNFDWRDKNAVTAVKDQAQCGSCWAFSTIEEIESQWILKGNKPAILSPQQVVDCDTKDAGCGGGDTPTAYEYVIKAGGLVPETSYPYKAKNEKCAFNVSQVAVKISGWKYVVEKKNETEMLAALYSAGPLSICVDAEPWQHYQSGIMTKNCGHSLDHCVLLVGFGLETASNTVFWNVRNSWGLDWGEAGYIRIERDAGNLCGVASEVTVAVI